MRKNFKNVEIKFEFKNYNTALGAHQTMNVLNSFIDYSLAFSELVEELEITDWDSNSMLADVTVEIPEKHYENFQLCNLVWHFNDHFRSNHVVLTIRDRE